MKTPFPGMDPYLEHPALWPDVHNRLIAALADFVVPLVAPRYYVALERRAYQETSNGIVLIGRPDVSVVQEAAAPAYAVSSADAATGPFEVEVPMSGGAGSVEETYLQIHEVKSGRLITLIELLSPANKLPGDGRRQYEQKRRLVLSSSTNLVEIDLLRAGEPMPVAGHPKESDYRILVSRGWTRPQAQLYIFHVRQPIPRFLLPLMPDEEEPLVDLNTVLHQLYDRARFDLRLNYDGPAEPPLRAEDAQWAHSLLLADG